MEYINKDLQIVSDLLGNKYKKFDNKNILLIGGLGFIGKNLLNSFLYVRNNTEIDFKLTVIDNYKTSYKENIDFYARKNVILQEHDILFEYNTKEEFDMIIFLAGIASPYYYKKYPLDTLHVSVQGLVNAFKIPHSNNAKFIFFSSSEIYGDPDKKNIPTKESYRGNVSSLGPRACYDESKRLGETLCYIMSTSKNKNVSIIRPFNVYGPGMNWNDYRIIPNILKSIKNNEVLQIYDTGLQTRTYCYIADALNGFMRVFLDEKKFSVYNIGSDNDEINVVDLVGVFEKVISKKIEHELVSYPDSYPSDQPQRRKPDITNAKNNLGYIPQYSIEEGINLLYDWFKNLKN